MKRILLLSLLVGSLTTLMAQVPRMVVIEEFTNASCPPCASQNPSFNAILNANLENVIPIKYQTSFPGFDPYNQQNPGEVATRLGLYPGVTGVPTAIIDGVIPAANYGGGGLWSPSYVGSPGAFNQNVVNYATAVESFLEISVESEYNEDLTSSTVTVTMINHADTELSTNHRIQVLLLEKENVWRINPGSTGERDFSYVMRKMYPNAGGTTIEAIAPGDTATFQIEAVIPAYIYNLSEMVFVAFVEGISNRTILNGALAEVVTVPSDFRDIEITSSNSTADDVLCGRTLSPGVTYTHLAGSELSEFTAIVNVAGTEYTQLVEESLSEGESAVVVFEDILLEGGSNDVTYNFETDGLRDLNLLNNILASEQYPSVGDANSTELTYGFESSPVGTNIQGIISTTPNLNNHIVDATYLGATNPMGGYGQSAKSIWVNFWQWEIPALDPNGSIVAAELVDASDSEEIIITFDRAHAQYNAPITNDRLIGMVSYDCGETWTQVYNKAGTALSTSAPNGSFFIPTATQWATDTIMIDNSAGNDNLLFKFDLVSDWGNNLYIDNINIEEFLGTSSTIRPSINADVSIAPNPSNGQAQLHIVLAEEADLNVSVYNSLGQRVANIGQYNYAIGEYKIDLNLQHLPAGMYQVVLQDGAKISNQKLMITK